MTKESVIESLYDSLEQIDPEHFIANQVENYINLSNIQTTSIDLSAFIAFQYDHDKEEAIAHILSDMDAEITQLETKKEKYQAINQGMMQELLTGKTRLV